MAKRKEMPPGYAAGKQLATILMITQRRVQMLVNEGVLPRPTTPGQYNLVPCIQAYIKYVRDSGGLVSASEMASRVNDARLHKTELEAKKLSLEIAQMEGELVNGAEVARQTRDMIAGVRTRLLALPRTLAPQVILETTPQGAEALVTQYVHQALEAFAAGQQAKPTPDDQEGNDDNGSTSGSSSRRPRGRPRKRGGSSVGTAQEADSERVGGSEQDTDGERGTWPLAH